MEQQLHKKQLTYILLEQAQQTLLAQVQALQSRLLVHRAAVAAQVLLALAQAQLPLLAAQPHMFHHKRIQLSLIL